MKQSENRCLAIIGAGGHGAVIADIARALGNYTSIEFYDDQFEEEKTVSVLLENKANEVEVVIGIGNNKIRLELADKFEKKGFKFATLLHPTIVLGTDVTTDIGTVAMARTVINHGTKIGKHCILNTGSTVDHHCKFGNGVHIGPGVNVAGGVTIGNGTFLGTGSGAIPNITIGSFAVVGAGAMVVNNIDPGLTVVGVPAK